MQFYAINLKAGIEYQLSVPGRYFLIDEITGANSVDVTLLDAGGSPRQIMPKRKVLFKCITDFGGVLLKSATDATVAVFVSFDDVHNGYADGGNVTIPGGVKVTNLDAEPVPISFPGGVVNMTATNVGIVQASTVTNVAPVAANDVAGVLIAAAAARKGIRIKNTGANPVAIGGAGVTYANAAIVIQPGETWNENEAAPAAWYAICGAGLASTLNLQTVQ